MMTGRAPGSATVAARRRLIDRLTEPDLFGSHTDLAERVADAVLDDVFPVAFYIPIFRETPGPGHRYLALHADAEINPDPAAE